MITVAVALVTFFWPQLDTKIALILTLAGSAVSLTLSSRLELGEIKQSLAGLGLEPQRAAQIQQWAKSDRFVLTRYNELRKEMDDLASGIYQLRTIDSVFEDDVRSIDEMTANEVLRSTCPISTVSAEKARGQIADARYRASVKAHLAAAQRGVKVTRVYLFRDEGMFRDEVLLNHLKDLNKRIAVMVLLHDEAPQHEDFDYLIFGTRRVSVGVVGGVTGTVQSAIVYSDRQIVNDYIERYRRLTGLSVPFAEAVRRVESRPS
ncbi:hypothetical protein [Amycolatopsis sp. RTGN1]|uniref:hypothetical protein n=1 Tax=Amycolatopsis ponsaeliensis TaxID=2992142 RepID=UPI00254A8DAF|nr:hypothetical protein [Amycolatopsis sp. RTGN1]